MGPTPNDRGHTPNRVTKRIMSAILMSLWVCAGADANVLPVALVLTQTGEGTPSGTRVVKVNPLVISTNGRGDRIEITGTLERGGSVRVTRRDGAVGADLDRIENVIHAWGGNVDRTELNSAVLTTARRGPWTGNEASVVDECARKVRHLGNLLWTLGERPSSPGEHKVKVVFNMPECAAGKALTIPLSVPGPEDIQYGRRR